jgi:hypothetical protein
MLLQLLEPAVHGGSSRNGKRPRQRMPAGSSHVFAGYAVSALMSSTRHRGNPPMRRFAAHRRAEVVSVSKRGRPSGEPGERDSQSTRWSRAPRTRPPSRRRRRSRAGPVQVAALSSWKRSITLGWHTPACRVNNTSWASRLVPAIRASSIRRSTSSASCASLATANASGPTMQ